MLYRFVGLCLMVALVVTVGLACTPEAPASKPNLPQPTVGPSRLIMPAGFDVPEHLDLRDPEGLAEAFQLSAGRPIPSYVKRLDPEIVVVFDRLPDYGDMLLGTFVGRHWYPPGSEGEAVLRQLGWADADSAERHRAVEMWITQGGVYGAPVTPELERELRERHAAELLEPLEVVTYVTTANDGVRVKGSFVAGWGEGGQPLLRYYTLRIDPAGRVFQD